MLTQTHCNKEKSSGPRMTFFHPSSFLVTVIIILLSMFHNPPPPSLPMSLLSHYNEQTE